MKASSSDNQVVSKGGLSMDCSEANEVSNSPCGFVSDCAGGSCDADSPSTDGGCEGLDFAAISRCFRWLTESECWATLATGIGIFTTDGQIRHRANPGEKTNSEIHHVVSPANKRAM